MDVQQQGTPSSPTAAALTDIPPPPLPSAGASLGTPTSLAGAGWAAGSTPRERPGARAGRCDRGAGVGRLAGVPLQRQPLLLCTRSRPAQGRLGSASADRAPRGRTPAGAACPSSRRRLGRHAQPAVSGPRTPTPTPPHPTAPPHPHTPPPPPTHPAGAAAGQPLAAPGHVCAEHGALCGQPQGARAGAGHAARAGKHRCGLPRRSVLGACARGCRAACLGACTGLRPGQRAATRSCAPWGCPSRATRLLVGAAAHAAGSCCCCVRCAACATSQCALACSYTFLPPAPRCLSCGRNGRAPAADAAVKEAPGAAAARRARHRRPLSSSACNDSRGGAPPHGGHAAAAVSHAGSAGRRHSGSRQRGFGGSGAGGHAGAAAVAHAGGRPAAGHGPAGDAARRRAGAAGRGGHDAATWRHHHLHAHPPGRSAFPHPARTAADDDVPSRDAGSWAEARRRRAAWHAAGVHAAAGTHAWAAGPAANPVAVGLLLCRPAVQPRCHRSKLCCFLAGGSWQRRRLLLAHGCRSREGRS